MERVSDIERLLALIEDVSEDIENADIRIDGLSPEFQELGQAVCKCLQQGQEIVEFTASISDGNLSVPIPPRGNYMAGPIKDLYYKLKHLEWQTNQVAEGDYSQHVDFLGSFSDAFNSMIVQLKQREETIRSQAEEQVLAAERETRQVERQMEIQYANYQAYREYTESFQQFRADYQVMMGEIYDLFQQNRYEEGRQLIAKINDRMGQIANIRRDYSNHDYINAALIDMASYCKKREIAFQAVVHIPAGFVLEPEVSLGLINHLAELFYLLAAASGEGSRRMKIRSSQKSVWLTIVARYSIQNGILPQPWKPDITHCMEKIRCFADRAGGILSFSIASDNQSADLILHLPKEENGAAEGTGQKRIGGAG